MKLPRFVTTSVDLRKLLLNESKDMEKSTDKTQKNWAKILKYTRDSASAMTGIDELNVLSDDEGGFTKG